MCNTSQAARIAKLQAIIDAYLDAILQLGTNGVQSYTLDTGQGKQVVTRYDLDKMRDDLNSYYNLIDVLCARENGDGVLNMGPFN